MSLDVHILRALRTSRDGWVSGTDLSQTLGVSRAAIWARIDELRRLGYDIQASPHHGYRIEGTPDLLHADDLLSRLPPGLTIGRDIQVFQETTSTNDLAEKLAQNGVAEGCVVFAESQTRGRGRLGRTWSSPTGKGLWFSVLLRPQLRPQAVTQVMVSAATALTRCIRVQSGLNPQIKWPNDVLINGLKVGGILIELAAELDRVRHVILGIGLDVNQSAGDLPANLRTVATSLRIQLGRPLDRPALAAALIVELNRAYLQVGTGGFESLADEWESQCITLGRNVSIQWGSRNLRGRAESLDPEGALLLRTEHGRLERITGGDVSLDP